MHNNAYSSVQYISVLLSIDGYCGCGYSGHGLWLWIRSWVQSRLGSGSLSHGFFLCMYGSFVLACLILIRVTDSLISPPLLFNTHKTRNLIESSQIELN